MIHIKHVYDAPASLDGYRILVERLWPRGLKMRDLHADAWMKEVAPSAKLRRWFGHEVERWIEFQRLYKQELNANPSLWSPILDVSGRGAVTLLSSARDREHNGAVVLGDYLADASVGGPMSEPRSHCRNASRCE
ncbi:MAG: DUF488 family protein [Steroidobacteraceae bacterium]